MSDTESKSEKAADKVKDKSKKSKSSKGKGEVHTFMVNSMKFVIDSFYKPLKPLGRGAYGVVCSAIDKSRGDQRVAIKKVVNAFDDLIDGKRILREIKLLRHFQHENCVGLVDLAPSPAGVPFNDLYIVLDFMETDLHKIIYSKNVLSDDHMQYFVYQILKGLKYIHSANVLHRDLKPSNLLLNSSCELKICDFGLARGVSMHEEAEYELTEYVVTRWYRAPEVMCSCSDYDVKIDVWSVGCILAELHGRKPLFPGDDYIKQMNLIFGVLGTPSEDDYEFISNEKALEYIKGLKPKRKVPFSEIYPNANPLALDLMDKMLTFNPHKRISVQEALEHEYFKALHNPETEPVCPEVFNFDFERVKMSDRVLRDLIWEEIYQYRPELKKSRGFAFQPGKD
mmetsp:Transcript_44325/g.86718  ORF Transcript_44325/g.86718 Transcript_44325/m.86718 type:complete len:397 (-) Transcript_44325:31-1221(-)|eukprot:CAMPEP_0175098082 /NCGR_PEP_ID=MMETSP0086_2-20121207/5643_1 /TAXON_ID=136419 /ORGANISM="Unknown Unknown, Strain D1" /LENGTH=396 /DNA_ID=CAMNT_0016371661 /DNA_START=31 /DNA_END=1221 /DNA_ORIENTATION=+